MLTQPLRDGPDEGPPVDDPAHALVGRVLDGRFQIDGVLARGGMGVVLRATDRMLDRDVVVKVLRPVTGIARGGDRLLREARLACRVQHPAIVTVFHLGLLETGEPYVVMERLRGCDLARFLADRGRLTLEETIAVLGPIAEALEGLHAGSVVHRDVKPANVFLIGCRAEVQRVKLIDFGLAMLDDEACARLTQCGTVIGTAEYIAPECARGDRPTAAADVYALATVAFEMLTGALPYAAEGFDALLAKTTCDARTLSQVTGVARDRALDPILARALSREPSERPTPSGLVRQLRSVKLDEPTVPVKLPPRVGAPRPVAPHPTLIPLAWASLATGVLALLTAIFD